MTDVVAYYPPETRAIPLTLVRRERLLPTPGRVLATIGQEVAADTPVAEAEISGEVSVVNVAQLLRVPAARAYRYVKVKEGQDVTKRTVIAAKGLFGSRRLWSPVRGFVYRVDKASGRVLIRIVNQPLQLTAGMPGRVVDVVAGRGVVIETIGAQIQAAFGFGGDAYGVLRVVSRSASDALRARSIDAGAIGTIIIGGAWIDEAALQQAIQVQVRGIIAGSLDTNLLEAARRAPFPILLTEGLGRFKMSPPIFKLLKSQGGREAAISAATRTRWGVIRPEVVVPLPSDSKIEAPAFGLPLAMGVRVRIVRGVQQSLVGTVAAIPPRPLRLENGTRVRGAEIDLGEDGKVFVPFANLEILR